MLREFRPSDAEAFFQLMRSQFPEEEALLGSRPEGLRDVVRRVYRWDYRLVLGLLRILGRPVFRFFVVEDSGKLAGVALLTYTQEAGYISEVVVDPAYRRRGHARRVVEACLSGAKASGRRYGVLDVLVGNAPARALYDKLGFQPLRSKSYMVKDLPAGRRGAGAGLPRNGRAFRRADAAALQKVLERDLPDRVLKVLPVERGAFSVPQVVAYGLGATTDAWVIDVGRGAEAFVRASVSTAMAAGNLTCPVIGPGVSDEGARQMVEYGLGWIAERGAPRVLSEVPDYAPRAKAALEAAGFVASYPLLTLYRDLGA
ncbi:MAG: GNAT family N-acetyltransferase [Thermoplasmata archaeon]|nr:GNAT family N-acetyltransferase [Thermoplasmata archaeon]